MIHNPPAWRRCVAAFLPPKKAFIIVYNVGTKSTAAKPASNRLDARVTIGFSGSAAFSIASMWVSAAATSESKSFAYRAVYSSSQVGPVMTAGFSACVEAVMTGMFVDARWAHVVDGRGEPCLGVVKRVEDAVLNVTAGVIVALAAPGAFRV